MTYAPVIIPTLSRYDTLKKCLESLNLNHDAEKTEVFISVDYPPAEKYKAGHDMICEYLDHSSFRFKQLHVIKQTENLGIINDGLKKYDNTSFLIDLVFKRFDRFILSEDDNVFSPGFLDYMNQGLEKFEDDPTVFSICGYRFYYNLKFKENNFFRQHTDFNGWGCGVWKKKISLALDLDVSYLRRMVYNPFKVIKLWRVSNYRVTTLCGFSKKKNFKKADHFFTIYMIDHNMTQIMPRKSLVRNIGWNNMGMHCSGFSEDVVSSHINQEIDDSPCFEGYKGTGWEFFKENQRVIRDEDFQQVSFKTALIELLSRIRHFNS